MKKTILLCITLLLCNCIDVDTYVEQLFGEDAVSYKSVENMYCRVVITSSGSVRYVCSSKNGNCTQTNVPITIDNALKLISSAEGKEILLDLKEGKNPVISKVNKNTVKDTIVKVKVVEIEKPKKTKTNWMDDQSWLEE